MKFFVDWKHPSCIADDNPARPWIILFNVILPTMIAIFSAVSTMIAKSSIIGDLGIEGSLEQWVTILFLLGINSTVPIANLLAERFGFKRLFFIGALIFAFSSLATGFAIDFWSLAIARFIEGVGAGIIFPVGMALIIMNFPKEKLGLAINIYMGFGFGAGMIVGTYFSGVIAMWSVWQNLFFVMVPFGIFAAIITWLVYDETERTVTAKFDLWGYLCFIILIASLVVALEIGNLSSTTNGWKSPFIIGCFVTAGISLILLIIFEIHAEEPVVPLKLFKYPLFVIGCVTLFSLGMSLFASVSFISSYMEDALHYDKYQTGRILVIYGVMLGAFSIVASFLLKKISPSVLVLIGLGIVIYSYFLNNILTIQSGYFQIGLILALRSMGLALALGPVTVHSIKNVPKELSGPAATLLTFFRQVGGTYGGAIMGIIVIRRNIFHTARFGEQVNPWLVGFKETSRKLTNHIFTDVKGNILEAKERATELIIADIKIQSYIQAINDAMIAFGYATIGVAIILIILTVRDEIRVYKKNKSISN